MKSKIINTLTSYLIGLKINRTLTRHFIYEVQIHAFFRSNTFISNAMLKLTKNQEKARQENPETELLYLKIIRFPYVRYHPKIIGDL